MSGSIPDAAFEAKSNKCQEETYNSVSDLRALAFRMRAMARAGLRFELRRPSKNDFDFAWSLYRGSMKPLTEELLEWSEDRQATVVRDALTLHDTSIITVDQLDVGWVQVSDTAKTVYLGQLYILPIMQSKGLGTTIVKRLCERVSDEGKILALEVMKNNRAVAFYERLGFSVIGQSSFKFKMQWKPGAA